MWFLGPSAYAIGSAILAALIFVTHRENIARLASGQEPKIGQKK
jgi:glycerol-3-phosphate acyltransferase PlsY